jgi:predicted NBD/HSP70 family sugar kinase/biotin operon repressor
VTAKIRSVANSLSVKKRNQRTLLLALLHNQPISRVRLARLTGLSTTTVTNLTAELVERGIVVETGTDLPAITEGAGRRPMALSLVPESVCVIGIHIGIRTIRVVLGNLYAQVIDKEYIPQEPGEPALVTVDRMAVAVKRLLEKNGLELQNERLIGVGVGASGLVAHETGINIWAPRLGWRDVPLQAELSTRLGMPVAVDNNVRCMALAESLYGTGQGSRALAFVYARVGVGAGLVVDGHIYRGADYGAGEIGHWTILPDGGDRCGCGNTGCLETLISEPVIVDKGRQVAPEVVENAPDSIGAIFQAARDGHEGLRHMLEERAHYAGIALANLINVLNPEMILVGGLLYQGYDVFQPVLERTMRQRAFADLGEKVVLRPATYGHVSGEVGALSLALDSFFFNQRALGH